MKKMTVSFILLCLPFVHTIAQWTSPQLVDMTASAAQGEPLVAVGPNRELVIACIEGSQTGKLLCYKSTDLGATFTRILVAEGGSRPPWYTWTAGTPASVGFNHAGMIFLLSSSIYNDDQAFFSDYVIRRMKGDSLHFTSVWYARGPGGPMASLLARPTMFINDTVLHVLSDERSDFFDYTFVHTMLSDDSLSIAREDTMFTLPNGVFDADLARTQVAVHCAISASDPQQLRYRVWYTRKLHSDSAFSPLLPVDTTYATSPHITDLGSGSVALIYAAGDGNSYSDSLLMGRVFMDGSTSLPPPFRLAVRPTRPAIAPLRSPRIRTHNGDHFLVYRSYNSTSSMVAYYQFADVQSAPLDSAFFTGYDYGDLALDSLGGKYLVMIGPNSRVYLSKKDVVSAVRDPESTPTLFALEQNYPNPFNPKTTIKFQIPNLRPQTAVSLKVYDLLGREIAMLVNEVKEPGVYTVQFDASGIASGVYCYQLRAGGHVETKMMLLLR